MFSEEIRIKRSFLHIILSIKDSLQQQIHFNGNIFGNKCCRCNKGSLYLFLIAQISMKDVNILSKMRKKVGLLTVLCFSA